MQKKLTDYVDIIQEDPAVQNVVGFVGGTTVNSGIDLYHTKRFIRAKIIS